MKKVVIYSRISTNEKKQDINRQIFELQKIIISHGYDEKQIDIYQETISGYKKTEDRPQLVKLIDDIKKSPGKYDCLYTSEISRIGRNPIATRKIIDEITDLKLPIFIQSLNLFTIDQNGSRNMVVNIILQVLIEYSNLETLTFKERSRSGLLKGVREGRVGGGKYIPYGYKKGDRKMLEIDEEEKEVVKLIFSLYKNGNGIKVISNILNEREIPTRSKKSFDGKIINYKIKKSTNDIIWSDKQVHDIIRNPIYVGKRRFKGEIYSSPQIIEEIDFEYCNQLLKSKKTRNINTNYVYLLKDIIKCGKCGRNYFGRFKPEKGGDKVYKCSSTLYKSKSCGNLGINIGLIESIIYQIFIQSHFVLRELKETSVMKKDLKIKIENIENQLKADEYQINENHKKLERLLNLHLNGGIKLNRYLEVNEEIENDLSKLTTSKAKKIIELDKLNITYENVGKQTYNKSILKKSKNDRIELRSIFNYFIDNIIINNLSNDIFLVSFKLKNRGFVFEEEYIPVLINYKDFRTPNKIYSYNTFGELTTLIKYDNNCLITSPNRILGKEYRLELSRIGWVHVVDENKISIG
jgi:site-specific DNA recombinase